MDDRAKIGKQSDIQKKCVNIKEDEMDIITFLKHYEQDLKSNQQHVIHHCRLKAKLRRTYRRELREDIYRKLKIGSSTYKSCEKILYLGFKTIPVAHLRFWGSYFWGLQSFEQLTETNIIPNGQWVIQNGRKHQIDIPQYPLPPTFITTIAKTVGITYFNEKDLIKHGFHTFTEHRCAYKAYYELNKIIRFFN